MPTARDAHARMFGLAHHAGLYERFGDRVAGRLYGRVAADVAAEVAAGRLAEGARVLDAGTGPGSLPLLLARTCPTLRIDAVDLAPEMIRRATERAAATGSAVTFAVADVARLPFPDETFDLVVSTLSQHHWADPAAGLRDVVRVLRPGGRAWVYDVRWTLGRAQAAALRTVAPDAVHRESPLPRTTRLNPVGRLVVLPSRTAVDG